MRIAHVGNGGIVPWRLAEAQRRLGHEVVVVGLGNDASGAPADIRIQIQGGPLGWNATLLRRARSLLGFDVLHIHGGIARGQLIWPALRAAFDVRLAVHYYGGSGRSDPGLHHRWAADIQFASTPDLRERLPRSQWVPDPVEVPPLPAPPGNRVARFGHVPALEAADGTERIIDLFRRVFGPLEVEARGRLTVLRGRDAELSVARDPSRQEEAALFSESDVIVDRFSDDGVYSGRAVDAMAQGKPVFGTANPSWYPDCPIVPFTAEGIEDRLRDVARDDRLRHDLGKAAHRYAARVHESGQVARGVLKSYYKVRSNAPLTAAEARAYWKRRGGAYFDEFAARPAQDAYVGQVEELLAVLRDPPFTSSLEAGCGFGRVSGALVRAGETRWVGFDLSRDQLMRARKDDRLAPRLLRASADAMPIADKSFDLVLSAEMLMHIPPESIGKVVAEMWRVARRRVVHLDWFEDFMVGEGTGWCWVHDYEALWRALGGTVRTYRLHAIGIQCVFVVEKTESPDRTAGVPPAHG